MHPMAAWQGVQGFDAARWYYRLESEDQNVRMPPPRAGLVSDKPCPRLSRGRSSKWLPQAVSPTLTGTLASCLVAPLCACSYGSHIRASRPVLTIPRPPQTTFGPFPLENYWEWIAKG